MWTKALDIRLTLSIPLFFMTAVTLSALYCCVTSFQMTGSLKNLARESRSEYRSESQTICIDFLNILTLFRATANPIFVVSGSIAAAESAKAKESVTDNESLKAKESVTANESVNTDKSETVNESAGSPATFLPSSGTAATS